jgi:phosphatidate cytidylyltransferase
MLRRPSKNFFQRICFGSLFFLVAALIIGFSQQSVGRWFFILGLMLFQTIALFEYNSLCYRTGHRIAKRSLLLFSNLYMLSRFATVISPSRSNLQYALLFTGIFATTLSFFRYQRSSLTNIALTFLGFLLVTYPISLMIDLNFFPRLLDESHTCFWLVYLLAVAKGSDMAAYLAGKSFGKHPLAPHLSPKKTIEGALSGVLSAAVISIALSFVHRKMHPIFLTIDAWGILGLVIGIFALFGDLSESLIKRSVGLKDSATIPGLGGTLDMIDSLIFASPFLYFYLSVTGVIPT